MRKVLSLVIAAMMSMSLMAVDYLVQTGAAGNAQWDAAVATATGATIVNLTTDGTTIDAWLAANAQGKEVWFAAGTYTFSAACANKANWKLYGGFAGTETAATDRQVGTNPWEMKNATIFDGNGSVQLFSGNAAGQVYDGITFQNANFAGNGSVMRLGNNGSMNACQFMNNKATTAGAQGTVQIYNGNGTFTGCYFLNNEAGQGGAIIANCTNAYSVSITSCRFENNFVHSTSTAANSGGAIQLQSAGVFTVERCYFTGNHVDNSKNGAAISNASSNEATVIANNVFTGSYGNHAVFLMGGKFYNNTVVNNPGGALYASGNNPTEVINNVFYGESKLTSGKMSVTNKATTTFKNNATITPVNGADLVLADNIVIDSVNTGTEEGHLYANFTDPANNDYTPATGSALIDAGTTLEAVKYDYVGTSRPQFDKYDIGAFEAIDHSKEIPNYIMTLTLDGQGTVANGARTWNATATDTIHEGVLVISAANGYFISTLTIDNQDMLAQVVDESYTTDTVRADININVVFKKFNLISVKVGENGTITAGGKTFNESGSFNAKDGVQEFVITPKEDFVINKVTFAGTDVTSDLTAEGRYTSPEITSDVTIEATFKDKNPIVAINGPIHVKVGGTGDGSSWENAMGDIIRAMRTAIADPANRQNVYIAGGTYGLKETITLFDSVSVYGSFAGTETEPSQRAKVDGGKPWEFKNPTIISGGDSIQCMIAKKQMETAIVVDGVTLTNGYSTTSAGGIRMNLNVTLQNSVVQNCVANGTSGGGGIAIYPAGDVINCLIQYNKEYLNANGGGGLTANTSSLGYTIRIEGNTFRGNESTIRGAAMNVQGQTPVYVNNNIIYNNIAIDGTTLKPGGAIYSGVQNVGEITNNLIYNNSGASLLYTLGGKVANNTVVKNVGAVYLASGTAASEVVNNIVWGSATDATGTTPTSMGGVNVNGMKMHNNATYNPLSSDKGWDLADNFQFSSNVSNGDVADATFGVGSGPKFRHVTSFIGAIDRSLSASDIALFESELADSADYRLNNNSPCLNAGETVDYAASDLTGLARPQGPKYDIGAFEVPYFNLNIGNYDNQPGFIYDEEGITLNAGTSLEFAQGQLATLYILSNDPATTLKSVVLTYSTDGGLTFSGRTEDVTAEVDQDGMWQHRMTESFQISIEWNTSSAIRDLAEQGIVCYSAAQAIHFDGLRAGDQVKVYNVAGQLLMSQTAAESHLTLEAQSGLYIVRVNGAAAKVVVK